MFGTHQTGERRTVSLVSGEFSIHDIRRGGSTRDDTRNHNEYAFDGDAKSQHN